MAKQRKSTSKKSHSAETGRYVTSSEHVLLLPAASGGSAFNYYATNPEEREAASKRFRKTVGKSAKKQRKN
jgi:hypothetical protein